MVTRDRGDGSLAGGSKTESPHGTLPACSLHSDGKFWRAGKVLKIMRHSRGHGKFWEVLESKKSSGGHGKFWRAWKVLEGMESSRRQGKEWQFNQTQQESGQED